MKSIKDKFMKIEAEIDYKIGKWKAEMERGFKSIKTLWEIFDDFTTGTGSHGISNWGKPLNEQNRIDLIWHELKQTTEVKLEQISIETVKPLDEIPWHRGCCKMCNFYRDWKTGVKYFPPRYLSEQDPEMIL